MASLHDENARSEDLVLPEIIIPPGHRNTLERSCGKNRLER